MYSIGYTYATICTVSIKFWRRKGDIGRHFKTRFFLRPLVLPASRNATHLGRNMVSKMTTWDASFSMYGVLPGCAWQQALPFLLIPAFGITSALSAALVACAKLYSVAIDHPQTPPWVQKHPNLHISELAWLL